MSEALFYANALEVSDKNPTLINVNNRAAAELRRLHAELERKSDAIQRLWKERDELRALNAELVEERDELRTENRVLVRQNGRWQEKIEAIETLTAELMEALRIVVDSDDRAAKQQARAALAKVASNAS